MMIYITNISFNYDEGFEQGFQNVSLNFQTVGQSYNINGRVIISKSDYMAVNGIEELRQKVKNQIVADLSQNSD